MKKQTAKTYTYTGLVVNVTMDDIKRGQRNGNPRKTRHETCPVALALRRATGCRQVLAGPNGAQIGGGAYVLPIAALRFMYAADCYDNDALKQITFKVGRKLATA